jgi:hypothetical protein
MASTVTIDEKGTPLSKEQFKARGRQLEKDNAKIKVRHQ